MFMVVIAAETCVPWRRLYVMGVTTLILLR